MPTKDFSSGYTATDNHGSATLVQKYNGGSRGVLYEPVSGTYRTFQFPP